MADKKKAKDNKESKGKVSPIPEHVLKAAEAGADLLSRGDDFVEAQAVRQLIKFVRGEL